MILIPSLITLALLCSMRNCRACRVGLSLHHQVGIHISFQYTAMLQGNDLHHRNRHTMLSWRLRHCVCFLERTPSPVYQSFMKANPCVKCRRPKRTSTATLVIISPLDALNSDLEVPISTNHSIPKSPVSAQP